ncbi:ABC transporter substrate-binding protein [Streptomyces sp. NPDC017179]|uniref:ABC transporter substrate-binding protein n=1 Tax=Streptomyces sp. NPDC017179 TaxID=3364979 RepID=UPI0037B85E3B
MPSPAEDPVAHASYLHHSLALGLREEVVAGLHAALKVSNRRSWLAIVQFACAAPQPPDGYLERHRESPVLCTTCPGPLPDGQCVGVSDGGYAFTDELGPVSEGIKALNDRVTQGKTPYATIALMLPMTPAGDSKADRAQLLREVQGAYLAQYRANEVDKEDVPIRLVLANPGRDLNHGIQVANWLDEMARFPKDRLRVVFGFNLSVKPTADTISYLTRQKGIPVVGGPITATDLANDQSNRYPGLVKVVPSHLDQAHALQRYLKVDDDKTFLIEDLNGDDLYSRSLRTAFREVTKGAASGPEQYDSSRVTNGDFKQMVNSVCNSKAPTLYFAGRPHALAQLINALGDRGCTDRPLRVVTVSGASTIALEPDLNWGVFTRGGGLPAAHHEVLQVGAGVCGEGGGPVGHEPRVVAA